MKVMSRGLGKWYNHRARNCIDLNAHERAKKCPYQIQIEVQI